MTLCLSLHAQPLRANFLATKSCGCRGVAKQAPQLSKAQHIILLLCEGEQLCISARNPHLKQHSTLPTHPHPSLSLHHFASIPSTTDPSQMVTVAVIGAGYAGIAAAAALLEEGIKPTVFDRRPCVGGIWSTHETPVFDNLTTNTSIFDTAFSAVPPSRVHPLNPNDQEAGIFFTKTEMNDYIERVVRDTPLLSECMHLSTTVHSAIRHPDGGVDVTYASVDTPATRITRHFDKVVVASGRFDNAYTLTEKELSGMSCFKGEIMHVSKYKTPEQVSNKKVVMVGGYVSGCEAAGDMASAPEGLAARHVTMSTRVMRSLVVKGRHKRSVLSDVSSRFKYLRDIAGRYGAKQYTEDIEAVVQFFSRNSDYGVPEPTVPLKLPGKPGWLPVNKRFLDACKEGTRLGWNIGGIKRVYETGVEYMDGTTEEVEVIVLSTGYRLKMDFLEDEVFRAVMAEEGNGLCDLYEWTFHPTARDMAFVGLWGGGGAQAPVYDCQARWVARVLAGGIELPGEKELWAGIKRIRQMRVIPEPNYKLNAHQVLDRFARLGGFEVDLAADEAMVKALLFGPFVPAQFRLFGHGKRDWARAETVRQMKGGGVEEGECDVSDDDLRELQLVWDVLKKRDDCPRGLGDAVRYLVEMNSDGGDRETNRNAHV